MALLRNPNLCEEAREILQEKSAIINQICKDIQKKVQKTFDTNNEKT